LTHFALTILTSLLAPTDAGVLGVGVSDASAGARADAAAITTNSASSPPGQATAQPRLAATAFATERQPRARRTRAWTRPQRNFAPRWESAYPEMHFSRFLDLARPDLHPPKIPDLTEREWRSALFRFASDVVSDLRDAIDLACPKGRCAPTLEKASQRLATFVREGARNFTFVDQDASNDHGNAWYGWRLTGGTTSFELGCNDVMEAPEVTCRLELDLADGLVMSYRPQNSMTGPEPDIAIRRQGEEHGKPLGEIRFNRTYSGTPVVVMAGSALASPPGQ
jgi:hypothetical protein